MNLAPALQGQEIRPVSAAQSSTLFGANLLTPGRFALLLGFVIAALYANVLFGGETFFYRDYGPFGYSLAKYHRDCFWSGHLPVWNSLSACGLPHLAQWNTMTLYPLSLIYLLLPMPWSLSFFCLAHLFLAGLGMYFLAFFWTKDYFAAAIAGAAYAFSGLTLHCLMWPNNIAGLACMPWVILTAQRGWQQGGRALLLAALVGAVDMLSGAPEIILFTWSVVFVLLMTELLDRRVGRVTALRRSIVIVALVVGLTAAQLLPFLDMLSHSHRDANYGTESWAMPPWGWVNLLLPLFRCSLPTAGVCFQFPQSWTSSYYPGVIVVFLALCGLRLAATKRIWTLWAVAVFCLVMALGERARLYAWIHNAVPFLGFMRYPVKFVVLPVFILPLLAAYGVSALRRSDEPEEAERTENCRQVNPWRWAMIVAGTIILVISGALLFSYWHPLRDLLWSDLLQNGLVRILSLGLLVGILFLLRSNTRLRSCLQAAAVLCVIVDLWTHMPNQNPTVPSSLYEPGLIAREMDPRCANGQARAFLPRPTYDLLLWRMVADHSQDHLGRRAGLFGNFNLLDGVPIADGCYSLYLLEERQIWSRLFFAPPTNFPAGLADFTGILQVSTKLFEWQTRPTAQPLVTAGASPVFLGPTQTLARLIEPEFDPRRTIYLPLEAKGIVSATNASSAHLTKTTYESGHITADVEASDATLVAVAESFYDGWHAHVDDKPTKVWRANHAFQAIEVPAGRHHVELIYKEKHLRAGGLLSGFTFLGCLVGWFRFRNKKPVEQTVETTNAAGLSAS